MNKKLIQELTELGDNSLVVIGESGLKRIYCPFKVKCLKPIHTYYPTDILFVTKVKLSKDLKLVYRIDELAFYHTFFEIM